MSWSECMDDPLRHDVRAYYRTVSRYIEKELARRRDREFWEKVGASAAGERILELGCGTGRVTSVLARSGSPIVGVDLSPEMLRRARGRLGRGCGVSLVMADMRVLPFSRTFRLVVAADDPFAHLLRDRDRRAALEAVADHLDPDGGRFILDAHWLEQSRWRRSLTPEGFHRERALHQAGSELRIREEWRCDAETRCCTVRYEYREDGGRPERASFRARLWSVDEMRCRLEEAGLRLRSLRGDYEGTPFEPSTAHHLVVEAERIR